MAVVQRKKYLVDNPVSTRKKLLYLQKK